MRAGAEEATRKLLATLWEKNLPVLRERLALLEAAIQAASTGEITLEQRKEAGATAHKLAGSLGMFGYPKGTEEARALEQSFDSAGALKKAELAQIATHMKALRSELGI